MSNTSELFAIMRNLTVDAGQSAATATTAAAKVGTIPELLEGILSHLPVLDLEIATGVSKTFRNVIQASTQLQQKLFMSPSKDDEEYWQVVTPGLNHYQDVIHLHRMVPLDIVDAALQAHLDAVARDPDSRYSPYRCLKVVSICLMVDLSKRYVKSSSDLGLSLMDRTFELQLRILPRASHAPEPWKNMLITSSPCQEA